MTSYDSARPEKRSLANDLWPSARHCLGSRTGMFAMAAVTLGAGAYFNWGWLVAAGVAPLIVGILPCAAMCALGLCMRGGSKPQSDAQAPDGNSAGDEGQSPTLQLAATDGKTSRLAEIKNQGKAASSTRKGCC